MAAVRNPDGLSTANQSNGCYSASAAGLRSQPLQSDSQPFVPSVRTSAEPSSKTLGAPYCFDLCSSLRNAMPPSRRRGVPIPGAILEIPQPQFHRDAAQQERLVCREPISRPMKRGEQGGLVDDVQLGRPRIQEHAFQARPFRRGRPIERFRRTGLGSPANDSRGQRDCEVGFART